MPVRGYVGLSHKLETVADVRSFLKELEHWKVTDDAVVEVGTFGGQHAYVVLVDDAPVEVIECGNHIPPDHQVDALVVLHECDSY